MGCGSNDSVFVPAFAPEERPNNNKQLQIVTVYFWDAEVDSMLKNVKKHFSLLRTMPPNKEVFLCGL